MSVTKKNTRKIKHHKKNVRLLLFLLGGTILISGGLLGWFAFAKPTIISPLPRLQHVLGIENTNEEKVVEKTLLKKGIEFKEVKRTSNGYVIQLKDDETVILSLDKEIAEQVDTLQVIHNRLTMEGRRFTNLDFRFEKPVITVK